MRSLTSEPDHRKEENLTGPFCRQVAAEAAGFLSGRGHKIAFLALNGIPAGVAVSWSSWQEGVCRVGVAAVPSVAWFWALVLESES